MAKATAMTIENIIGNWNSEFPEYQLTVEDLKKSHSMIGAVLQIIDRLGIDRDAVLMPPSEKNLNEHIPYYWDLLPVINVTRVVNNLISVMPEVGPISINHFLQPTAHTSQSILLLLLNLMLFNEQRLQSIAPHEEELFHFTKTVKALEDKKSELFEKLNQQAQEKGKRADRMEQMHQEIKQIEEELRHEEQARDLEKQDLDALVKENSATDALIEQKRATREGLLAERERKKALRVYDASDIRAQAVQAAQNMQEAEEKLNSLQATINQKENNLQILQTIKPNLDTANNLLHEIDKLKDFEAGDLDADSKDSELGALRADLAELNALRAELTARREQHAHKRADKQALRQEGHTRLQSAVREAEDKDKKRLEFITRATRRTQEIQLATDQYDQEKTRGLRTVQQMKEEYDRTVKEWEEIFIKLLEDTKADLDKKILI